MEYPCLEYIHCSSVPLAYLLEYPFSNQYIEYPVDRSVVLLQASLEAYQKASQMLTDTVGAEVPPEILNNIAALHFRLGKYEEAKVQSVCVC